MYHVSYLSLSQFVTNIFLFSLLLSNLHGTRDDDFKLKVESSCLVVKTILSSWPGVMLMSSCMSQCLTSSLSALIKVLPLIGVSAQVCFI